VKLQLAKPVKIAYYVVRMNTHQCISYRPDGAENWDIGKIRFIAGKKKTLDSEPLAILRIVFIFGRGLDRSRAATKADPIKLSHHIISCHQKAAKAMDESQREKERA
jgi:hypothetical protein